MALKGISNSEHQRLMARIDQLEIAGVYKQELSEAFTRYHLLVAELSKAIAQYEDVAARIRPRQPLRKAAMTR